MRIRAGIVLIEDDKVALIERYRDGKHYFVFPGGGADGDETPKQAAIREMDEETGLRVTVKRKLAEIHFGQSASMVSLGRVQAKNTPTLIPIIRLKESTSLPGCRWLNCQCMRMFIPLKLWTWFSALLIPAGRRSRSCLWFIRDRPLTVDRRPSS